MAYSHNLLKIKDNLDENLQNKKKTITRYREERETKPDMCGKFDSNKESGNIKDEETNAKDEDKVFYCSEENLQSVREKLVRV